MASAPRERPQGLWAHRRHGGSSRGTLHATGGPQWKSKQRCLPHRFITNCIKGRAKSQARGPGPFFARGGWAQVAGGEGVVCVCVCVCLCVCVCVCKRARARVCV